MIYLIIEFEFSVEIYKYISIYLIKLYFNMKGQIQLNLNPGERYKAEEIKKNVIDTLVVFANSLNLNDIKDTFEQIYRNRFDYDTLRYLVVNIIKPKMSTQDFVKLWTMFCQKKLDDASNMAKDVLGLDVKIKDYRQVDINYANNINNEMDEDINTGINNIKEENIMNEINIDRNDDKMDQERQKRFLTELNTNRCKNGLRQLSTVICYICGQRNAHLTYNCPESICKICRQKGHLTRYCAYKACFCQYCGGNHASFTCNSLDGITFRTKLNSRCLICHKFGHMAMDCQNNANKINNYKKNNNFNKSFYRNKKKYRNRKKNFSKNK